MSIPPFGRGFSRHWGLPIRWVLCRAQRRAPPRSGHRLDEPARLSLSNGCIPAVPASVFPGKVIVTPAPSHRRPPPPRGRKKGKPGENESGEHPIFAIELLVSY